MSSPPAWAPCEDLDSRDDPHACPDCGSNSASINAFPINGLHPGGCWNADDIRLVPGTLSRDFSACPETASSLSFDPQDSTMIGVDSSGVEQCRGPAVVGAKFAVEAWIKLTDGQRQLRRTWIRISQARTIQSSASFPAYMMSPVGDPSASLCDTAASRPWRNAWVQGEPEAPQADAASEVLTGEHLRRVPVALSAAYVLPMGGDVFDQKAVRIPRTGPNTGWMNLACAGGGLAKLRLDGLELRASSRELREAALRMLTGRYCKGESRTLSGPMISWVHHTEPEPAALSHTLEARWGRDGALCMSRSRLWRPDTLIPVLQQWAKVCKTGNQPAPCSQERFVSDVSRECEPMLAPCGDTRPDETLWTTYVMEELPADD